MIEQLIDLDKRLLLFLNGFHTSWLDPMMFLISNTLFWLPLYLWLIFATQKKYQKATWLILAGGIVTILLADQTTASLMKPYFARLRPSHDPSLKDQLHLVTDFNGNIYFGGLYGFASSHAANTFGTALFFFFFLKPFYRWTGLLFAWAALMTYTRIYLGVHFPGDILVGAMVGIAAAVIAKKVVLLLARKYKYDLGLEKNRI
jgi:undecaprenyl-diphosphatase